MTEELPVGTRMTVDKAHGRTVLRVELPLNSGSMTRKQKQIIKAMVRKQVKAEKKKAKKEMINEQTDTATREPQS